MTDEEKREVEFQVRSECARIAALESQYWGFAEDARPKDPHIDRIPGADTRAPARGGPMIAIWDILCTSTREDPPLTFGNYPF